MAMYIIQTMLSVEQHVRFSLFSLGVRRFFPTILHPARMLYTVNIIPTNGSSCSADLVPSHDVKHQATPCF
jgi:hypothetical protein